MPSKLKTAKTLMTIWGVIYIVVGAILGVTFLLVNVFTFFSSARENGLWASILFGSILLFVGLILVALGIFHIITAKALAERKSWAKASMIVLSILMVGSFPLGTIFAIFILIGIFDTESLNWLENKSHVVPNAK